MSSNQMLWTLCVIIRSYKRSAQYDLSASGLFTVMPVFELFCIDSGEEKHNVYLYVSKYNITQHNMYLDVVYSIRQIHQQRSFFVCFGDIFVKLYTNRGDMLSQGPC